MKSSPKRLARPLVITAAMLLAATALVTVQPANAAVGDGSTGDSNITYVGRWDKTSSAFYRSNWAGSYLRTGFTGTTVKLRERNLLDLYVGIDGAPFVSYVNVQGVVDLTPKKLAAGRHRLVVAYKQVAGHYTGDAGFGGLVLDPGAKTFAIPVRPQLIEWIGDSITAGATSSRLALTDYAWLASEQVGVEHTQIAAGGWCLTEVAVSGTDKGCMGHNLRYVLRSGALGTPVWDFSTYQPAEVVINLGTNDRSHGVSTTTFQANYLALIKTIRARYPRAAILALKTFSGRYTAQTQAAVAAANAAGDHNVFFVSTDGWLPADGSGLSDSVHPNDAGHQAIAAKLVPILTAHLGSGPPALTYKVVNHQSGKVLSVAGSSTADGAAAVQAVDTGSAAQRWRLVSVVGAGGGVEIVNVLTGKNLDVAAKSLMEGAPVIQYRDNGGANQSWTVSRVTAISAYSTVVSRLSAKALDVAGSSTADGAALIQSTPAGSPDQEWQFVVS